MQKLHNTAQLKQSKWHRPLTRRQLLSTAGKLSMALSMGALPALAHSAARSLSTLPDDPFTLGVASGDPTGNSVVLWTRLAKEVLTTVGAHDDVLQVHWELAEDENFSQILRSGIIAASPALGHSVHAEVRGLSPASVYYFRWHIGNVTSPIGRTKTAPAADVDNTEFSFAFASCQQYEHGFYSAYKHMAVEQLDLIVHLGDYIYERSWGDNLVRAHEGPEILNLDDYRARYTTYKSDSDLQAAHASAPWVVTWDDHEVDNNYAAEVAEDDQTPEQLLSRRAAAYQAFYEFMPIRLPVGRQGPAMPIHRRLRFGKLMEMHVLDTRQYRSDQACGDGRKPSCSTHQDSSRTLLGAAQKDWLYSSLATTDSTWNVLAQQVMMASLRSRDENGNELWPMDIWDGYPHERQQLLETLHTVGTPNPVVLTGDIHSNWAADLKLDFDDPGSATVGSEFVGTSITSGGDGRDMTDYGAALLANNPHVKFYNAQRGYVKATLSPEQWLSEYKVLERVTEPGAPISVRKRFIVEAGQPGVQEA
ncbi:MAG: alkaline phosphatase D family protein [Gammaproteobacteria bacterium]|nr:alkaline phosphatase D family protein [Gammaproteobacteria bacterium]MCY4358525.1 alkaline phosphatase D family protein [Gammaproteobacteria bacterium]